jgi:hypothetical protein
VNARGWHSSNRCNRKMRKACKIDPEMRTLRQTWTHAYHCARKDAYCMRVYNGMALPDSWVDDRAYARTMAAR